MTRHELPYISDYYDVDGNPTTPEYRRQRMAEEAQAQEQPKRSHEMRPGDRIAMTRKLDRIYRVRQSPEGHTNQARNIRAIRQMAREFSTIIVDNTPSCADQSAALRCVREAVVWAEESIHLEGLV